MAERRLMQTQEARDAEQLAAVNVVLNYWSSGQNRVALSYPTGFGKTRTAALLIKSMKEDMGRAAVAFVTDRVLLLDQTAETMQALGLRTAVMQGPRTATDAELQAADVVMTSWQTVDCRQLLPDDLYVLAVVLDETHTKREVAERWLDQNIPALGLTATPLAPWMVEAYDVLYAPLTTVQCIESGYLQSPLFRVDIPDPTQTDHGKQIGRSGEDWSSTESEMIMSPHTQAIADAWRNLCDLPESEGGFAGREPPTVVQASTKNHAKALAEAFERVSKGEWACLTDDQDQEESKWIVKQYRAGHYIGLVTVHKAAVGFDAPDTSILVAARPTRKLITWIQFIGRLMRLPVTERGELKPVVLDCAGNAHRFAAKLHRYWNEGAKWPLPTRAGGAGVPRENEPKPKVCPDHPAIVQSISSQVCEVCYRPLIEPEPVVERKKFRADVVTIADVAHTVLYLAQRRCLEHGVETAANWARTQMQLLTGSWPRNTWPSPSWTRSDYGKPHPVVRRTIKSNGAAYAAWADQDEGDRGMAPTPQRIVIEGIEPTPPPAQPAPTEPVEGEVTF